jgi:hypothetical protein
MWLVHSTKKWNLKKILEEGEIKSSTKTKNVRYSQDGEFMDGLFMSVIFDDVKVLGDHDALIFFPIDIMDSYGVSHWASGWLGGDPDYQPEGYKVIQYDDKKSAKQNAEVWQEWFYKLNTKKMYKTYRDTHDSAKGNEVIFTESIPMGEASFIYLRKDKKVKFEVPDRIDNARELNKLLMN